MDVLTKANVSEDDVNRISLSDSAHVIFISDKAYLIFSWIIHVVVNLMVASFGAGTNIINIICYVKLGLKDSVNVNFLGLAVSDLGALVTIIFASFGYIPTIQETYQSVTLIDLLYLTAGWPHVIFARVTSWITALTTLERCLCITMPLKVKTFLTPQRSAFINVCLYIIVICSVSPVYYANSYGWRFSPERNRTIFGLVFAADREKIETIAYASSNIIAFLAFIIVIVCTIILVISLRRQSKWRERSTHSKKSQNASSRDQKLGKMIIVIATVFIASYIPVCITFVAMIFVPSLSLTGHNINTLLVCCGLGVVLEEINSAVNIFVYYHMSSKYKQVFCELFHCFATGKIL